jgi:hypothetical protein
MFALFLLSDFYKRMMRVYSTYLKITGESHIALAAGILVGVLMIGMGVLGWFDRERRIEEQWVAIKNK